MSGFVHLHCHSTWSLLDGAIPAEVLPHLAAVAGFEAVAITDHDALTGAVRFSKACRDAGVKPIFGAELTVGADADEDARPDPDGRSGGESGPRRRARAGGARGRGRPGDTHVTVIARDRTGYGNLCRLISDAHLSNERGRPQTSLGAIAARSQGLVVLSGCARGEVARLAAAGDIPRAVAAARRWHAAIGDGYRLEVFDHRGYGHHTLRNRLLQVAAAAGVRAVATNDVHYATPTGRGRIDGRPAWGDAAVHELLHAIHDIVPLSHTQALRRTSEYYLKEAAEMRALFRDAPEALDETVRITEACDFDLHLEGYHFPEVPIPKGYTPTGLLAQRCYEGARKRFGAIGPKIEDRLQHELGAIFHMGWAAYFLLVADIVGHTRDVLGIRCACRGSAAGSLVCYVLGISDVDPIRYDLLFERFMNERRDELPDIDVDVESHRREEVLDHILDTYGSDQTAVCCMVDTFRARLAIREVGKALGLPAEEIDVAAKAFPHVRASDIPQAMARLPELAGTNLDAGQLDQLFELCRAIDGWPRHLALHPSGVVLSSNDLGNRVPMESSFEGFTMLQADKDDVEDLGLIKLDVLGVRMLSAIAHAKVEVDRFATLHDETENDGGSSAPAGAVGPPAPGASSLAPPDAVGPPAPGSSSLAPPDAVGPPAPGASSLAPAGAVGAPLEAADASSLARGGLERRSHDSARGGHPVRDLDLDALPDDDPATFALIRSSRTLGCFQIESPGQRELLARFGPERFEDLIIDISLFRPGPVQSDMVSPFLERRHGFEATRYPHPSLEPILAETNGVIVYHEQVIRVIAAVTGCSLADADYVRRNLGAPPAPGTSSLAPPGPVGPSPPAPGTSSMAPPSAVGPPPSAPGTDSMAPPSAVGPPPSAPGTDSMAPPSAVGPPPSAPGTSLFAPPGDVVETGFQKQLAAWFIGSATSNGFSDKEAVGLWNEVAAFASFGFCKSHAAAFALPTYISAWLKAHYPAEFLAGVLTHDPGMYPRRLIVADARQMGIPILPIDVNRSDSVYRVEVTDGRHKGIRLALSEVREISKAEIDSILEARREGNFTSLEDLRRRTVLSRPVLENLVHVGALDSISGSGSKRELLWRAAMGPPGAVGLSPPAPGTSSVAPPGGVGPPPPAPGTSSVAPPGGVGPSPPAPGTSSVAPPGGVGPSPPAPGTRSLAPAQLRFDLDTSDAGHELSGSARCGRAGASGAGHELIGLAPYTPFEETQAELEVSGIDARRHVMELYRPFAAALSCTPSDELRNRRNDSEVWVAGVKVASQTPAIRSGQRIIFITLDDLTGPIDVTVFARAQQRCAHTVFHSWLLVVRGRVRKRGGASLHHVTDPHNVGITVVAAEVFDLAELAGDQKTGHSVAAALGRQRRRQTPARWSDRSTTPSREPDDGDALRPRGRMWHASGGSAGG